MLSLYKLEIFAAVVREGSFSAAAARLHMTQPAISQHIQDLEHVLGTTLFKRGRRGVTLTSTGETLHNYTNRILQLVAEAEAAVTDIENLSGGQVRIGATPGVGVYLLPEWVRSFQSRVTQVTVNLQTDVTTRIVNAVLDHRLDIGFVEGELESVTNPRLARLVLQDIALSVVVGQGHAWWNRDSIPVSALDGRPFVARPLNSDTRSWLDNVMTTQGIQPRIVAEFDNPESIKHAVMSGLGITVLPEYAAKRECESGLLRTLAIDDLTLQRSLKLVWDQQFPFAPPTRAFLLHLARDFPQLHDLIT